MNFVASGSEGAGELRVGGRYMPATMDENESGLSCGHHWDSGCGCG